MGFGIERGSARRTVSFPGKLAVIGAALAVATVGPAAAAQEGPSGLGGDGMPLDAEQGFPHIDGEGVFLDAEQGFSDIGDAGVHRADIETLADRGILAGTECAPEQFCPKEPIRRWVMAVWLVRAVDEAEPAVAESSRFVDVETGEWWSPYVERLADLGITRGCSTEPARFCPTDPVTRAQMATFLVRAFQLEPEPSNKFADVEKGDTYTADINALAAAGITAGCAIEPDRYCPTRDTNRAQMATFLARALGIDAVPQPEETTPPPESGGFTAIVSGWDHSCGIQADRTVICWGHNWATQAEPPAGEFMAVAAGRFHSCGINTHQNGVCWGQNWHGQTDAPEGTFTAITAGGDHSCGIRTDQTITCWGHNGDGQADPPPGEFVAIAAGELHTCALRSPDHALACWGHNGDGQADPPPGEFVAIAVGNWHSCGLKTGGITTCWGGNWAGQAQAPAKRFSAIAAGWEHTCGVDDDQTIICWGRDEYGRATPPQGEFTNIALGDRHSCGLRTDATITCWGLNPDNRIVPLQTEFTTLAVGVSHACGLSTDQTISCWGRQWGGVFPPEGEFATIATGSEFSCGLRIDQTVACWGANWGGQADPPPGAFVTVQTGLAHACGLRTDQMISCWGHNGNGQASPPEGEFVTIAAGGDHSCALRADHTVACWGANSDGQADPPAREFTAITAGMHHSCGLSTDGAVVCWGYDRDGQADPPVEELNQVTAGRRHSCGLRTDQTLVCWGSNNKGASEPPEGTFITVAAGNAYSCGLRTDHTITCWGQVLVVKAPVGVEQSLPVAEDGGVPDGPTTCRPPGPAGFPSQSWAVPSLGTIRVAVLFMDFPEAQATHTTHQEAELGLPFVEKYLETVSYGNLNIEFAALHRWLRAEHDYNHYRASGGLNAAAIQLADPEFDFTGFDALMIVLPSSHFGGGVAGGIAMTEEGVIRNLTRINTFPLNEPREPYQWRLVGAHELAHNLGLLDLYSYDSALRQHPDPPAGKRWVNSQIGLMGLWAFFLASEEDPRLAHVWRHPKGYRSTAFTYHLQAPEMLAWSRWQLGWLDPTQIRCVTELETETTITISPAAFPGSERAMIAIPVSKTELIVVESRRKVGYDFGEEYLAPDGSQTTFPVLAGEGVLIYTVNASLGNGRLPLRVVGSPDGEYPPLHFADYPLLTEGQSVIVGGYVITVHSTTYYTDTVTITKIATP